MAFFNKKNSYSTGLQATNDEKSHRITEKTVRLPEISESGVSPGIENTGISHTDLANSTVKGHFSNDRNEAKRKSSSQQHVGNIGNYGNLNVHISTDSTGTDTITDVRYTDTPEVAGNRFDAPEGAIEDSKTLRAQTRKWTAEAAGNRFNAPEGAIEDCKTLPDIPDEQIPDKKVVNNKKGDCKMMHQLNKSQTRT